MRYVCDAPQGMTWFRLETEAEAEAEARRMEHAVDRFFREARARAVQTYQPVSTRFIEQEIGLKAHIEREMPRFLSLRDENGDPHVTAMIPNAGAANQPGRVIVVGFHNSDPYPEYAEAIDALAQAMGCPLDRSRCYPYH